MTQARDFWSQRRAAVEEEERAALAMEEANAAELERAALDDKDDAEILAELNLPDPDDLALGDDVSGFMAKAVPDRLRRRALRKLWRLNPVLANIDGLVDYGEDFTDAATVIENMQTTYQVGKGMLAHVQEMARQAAAEEEDEALEEDQETEPLPDPEPEPEIALVAETAPEPDVAEPAEDQSEPEIEYATAAPRRMRFEFEGRPA